MYLCFYIYLYIYIRSLSPANMHFQPPPNATESDSLETGSESDSFSSVEDSPPRKGTARMQTGRNFPYSPEPDSHTESDTVVS